MKTFKTMETENNKKDKSLSSFKQTQKRSKEEEEKEKTDFWLNQGREICDSKWINAIKKRIEELERINGITELKKILNGVRYRW